MTDVCMLPTAVNRLNQVSMRLDLWMLWDRCFLRLFGYTSHYTRNFARIRNAPSGLWILCLPVLSLYRTFKSTRRLLNPKAARTIHCKDQMDNWGRFYSSSNQSWVAKLQIRWSRSDVFGRSFLGALSYPLDFSKCDSTFPQWWLELDSFLHIDSVFTILVAKFFQCHWVWSYVFGAIDTIWRRRGELAWKCWRHSQFSFWVQKAYWRRRWYGWLFCLRSRRSEGQGSGRIAYGIWWSSNCCIHRTIFWRLTPWRKKWRFRLRLPATNWQKHCEHHEGLQNLSILFLASDRTNKYEERIGERRVVFLTRQACGRATVLKDQSLEALLVREAFA